MIFAAYDAAWSEIEPQLNPDPVAVEAARTALATIVLGLAANTQPTAPSGLSALAINAFSAKHRIEVERG